MIENTIGIFNKNLSLSRCATSLIYMQAVVRYADIPETKRQKMQLCRKGPALPTFVSP
jgi:hypothetical protein